MATWSYSNLAELPVVKIPINSLVIEGSPRCGGESSAHVQALAGLECKLPPIVVHRQTLRIIDGAHRLRAATMRGEKEIEARMFDGDDAASFVVSVQANITHGLPLSLADRRAAAVRIMELFPDWSDRMVAQVAGIAASTVAKLRRRPTAQNEQLDTIGRDGRVRHRDSFRRRELARELMHNNPTASLRGIARTAGVSPETVRSIRKQLDQDGRESYPDGTSADAKPDTSPNPGLVAGGEQAALKLDEKQALQRLKSDPAFRATESGRFLLRIMSSFQAIQEGQHLVHAIPDHCQEWFIISAHAYANAWQDLAECAKIQVDQKWCAGEQ